MHVCTAPRFFPKARLAGGCIAAALCTEAPAEEVGFIEGARATLQARNYFFSRDYGDIKGASTQSRTQEWAQGFILNASSGYSQGVIGAGLDVIGLLGFKLDSSPEHARSGLLPSLDSGTSAD
ncbi:MAG TPA: outer membrane porin, OprD family, partial [Pseudomonas sp.]|nr:outer membrane porin, OprD family [Pseudomonas sp.]